MTDLVGLEEEEGRVNMEVELREEGLRRLEGDKDSRAEEEGSMMEGEDFSMEDSMEEEEGKIVEVTNVVTLTRGEEKDSMVSFLDFFSLLSL